MTATPKAGAKKLRRCQTASTGSKGNFETSQGCGGRKFYNFGMSVFALGLNHTTAPVDLRGRFAFTLEQLAPTLQTFRHRIAGPISGAKPSDPEAAILSTCNRTELYCAAEPALVRPAIEWLAGVGGVGADTLTHHAYVLEGGEAARHAFRVASGLDSMVLGEPQILRQLKQAVR